MTESNLDERFAAAQRWYSKLPRNEFDHILTLLERERLRERDLLGRSVKRLTDTVEGLHRMMLDAEAKQGMLESALMLARDRFRHYGDLHAAKPDVAKATANYELAQMMEYAVKASRDANSPPTFNGQVMDTAEALRKAMEFRDANAATLTSEQL
jgi:hypothetical protein